jgi:hypothetical protein
MGEREQLAREVEFRKLFLGNPSAPAAGEGLLSLSSRQYQEYADEWKQSAQTASSDAARELALKMAHIWLEAAMQCEAGLATSFTERHEGAADEAVRLMARVKAA